MIPITKPKHARHMPRSLAAIAATLTLMLCIGVFTATALASTCGYYPPPLIVNTAWLDGETIRIDVTDPQTGTSSSIAVPLSDHLRTSENIEFIAIQAVDADGRQSGVIEVRNPLFNPNLPQPEADTDNAPAENENGQDEPTDEPHEDNQLKPLTPDGTGTVIDNITDNGREFFTIGTEDGNVFFLIIDRHRDADNVYLLNAVTEEDLISLAQAGGRDVAPSGTGSSVSAIPIPPQVTEPNEQDPAETTHTPEAGPADERPSALRQIGSNLLFFIGIIAVVGGLAYYIKVVRPRKSGFADNYGDEPDDYGYDNAVDEDDSEPEDGDED